MELDIPSDVGGKGTEVGAEPSTWTLLPNLTKFSLEMSCYEQQQDTLSPLAKGKVASTTPGNQPLFPTFKHTSLNKEFGTTALNLGRLKRGRVNMASSTQASLSSSIGPSNLLKIMRGSLTSASTGHFSKALLWRTGFPLRKY